MYQKCNVYGCRKKATKLLKATRTYTYERVSGYGERDGETSDMVDSWPLQVCSDHGELSPVKSVSEYEGMYPWQTRRLTTTIVYEEA